MATRLSLRRDKTANWTSANPVLADGEPGYDEENHDFKIGDGVTAWLDLPTVALEGPTGPQGPQGTPGVADDSSMTAVAADTTSQFYAQQSATYEAGTAKIVYVSPTGNDARSGLTMSAAKATLAGAHAVMGTSPGMIVLDNGVISVSGGFKWPSTAKCGMVGQGPANTSLQASAQSGPVLDLSGVGYNLQRTEFGGFTLLGDGVASSANKGMVFDPVTSYTLGFVHDIIVQNTGGACFDLGAAEVNNFDRLVAYEPVGAVANDIPYLRAAGPFNGNRILGLQLQATSAGANVGISGAVVITDNGTYAPHDNLFTAPLIEFLHVQDSGTIFSFKGNANVVSDFQNFDSSKVSGATGTSYFRFSPPSVGDIGGSVLRGVIPGKSTGATDIDMGVDMRQSRNNVTGVKGYKGTNVVIAAGVNSTYVRLGGAYSSSSDPAVIDNSGTTTNSIDDGYSNYVSRPGTTFVQSGAHKFTQLGTYSQDIPTGWYGPRFFDPATPANGRLGLGTGAVRIDGVGNNMKLFGTQIQFMDASNNPTILILGSAVLTNVTWRSGAGSPEGVVTAAVGSLYSRTDGGAATTLYVKESGTGNTGWIAK